MKKGYKECPFCANEIKEKAIKCQFCGEFLDNSKEKVHESNHNVAAGNLYYDVVKKIHCPSCGYIGDPKKLLRGNTLVGFLLYRFAIIPGVIFSIWRRKKTTCCCPTCGNGIVEIIEKKSENEIEKQKKLKRKKYIIGFLPFIIIIIILLVVVIDDRQSSKKYYKLMQTKGYNVEFSVKVINDVIYSRCNTDNIRAKAQCIGACEEGNIEVSLPCEPNFNINRYTDMLCDLVTENMEKYNVKGSHDATIHTLKDGKEVYKCTIK